MQGNAGEGTPLMDMRTEAGVRIMSPTTKRLDAAVAPAVRAAVTAEIAAGNRLLVLDLSKVDFMDSSALGAVVSCLKALGGRGDFAVSGAQGAVMKLFQLTRLDRVLKLHDTPEAAAAAIRA